MHQSTETFLDPQDPQIYPALAKARSTCPVPHSPGHGRNPTPRRNVTRWEDVDRVLRDATTFSSKAALDDIPHTGPKALIGLDGVEHRKYRSIIERSFSPGELRKWEERLIAPPIHRLLEPLCPRGEAELVSEVIRRYPVQVICALLGVPMSRIEEFQRWGTDMILGAYDDAAAAAAAAAMTDFLSPIVEDRRQHPKDDLISHLLASEVDGERLDDEGLYSFLRLLLPAGADTTWRALGSALVALLERPEVLAHVREDRSMIPAAVEETLRWESPAPRLVRTPTVDVEIAECPIEAGTVLEVWPGSANRDEARFDDPDEWHLDRHQRHIAFGVGRHTCIGLHLARMELELALNAILDYLPGLRLDPRYPAPVIKGHALRGPDQIHVLFDAPTVAPGSRDLTG